MQRKKISSSTTETTPECVIYDVTEGLAPQSQKKYDYHFTCFLNHFDGITSKESLLEKDVKVIEAMIIQWIKHLFYDRHHKHSTIHNEVAAVIHFFDWNDVRLNTKKINRSIPRHAEVKQHDDKHYSHDQIWQIHSKCDERGKVIILLMASTGCRLGALPGLRFCDITEVPECNLYRIQIYARTEDSHYAFCTPECKKAIDEYRTFREVHGETIDKDSPLLRELFDTRVKFAAARPKAVGMEG